MWKSNHVIASLLVLLSYVIVVSAPLDQTESVKVSVSERVLDSGVDAADISIEIHDFNLQSAEVGSNSYELYSIENEHTISQEGWPDLPFIARTIVIPPQSDIQLDIVSTNSRIESVESPVIAPRELNDGTFEHIGEAEAYQQFDGFYPPNMVEVGTPAILRGYRLVTFRYYPMQYNRSTGEMRFNESINFQLTFDGIGENIVHDPDRPRPSNYIYNILKNITENPPDAPDRDDVMSGNYLYIVPNVNGVMDAVEPLIEWRRRQGHKVTVAQVANNAGLGTIRDIIDEAYESDNPVEYVALVGDAANPIRVQSYNNTGDYGYTRVDGNDALPDIAIGRLSCTSIAELRRIVNKLVSYESDPYMDDVEWFNRGTVIAGHIENGLGTVLLAKYVKKLMLTHGLEEVDGWYHNEDGEIRGDQNFVTSAFDDGVSLFHYRAFSRMNALSQNVLWNLPNRQGMWPAVLAVSCNTGNFVSEMSYTEVFLRADGGGIGAIGTATGETNVKFNNIVSGGFWRAVLQEETYAFGWGLNAGKYELWRAYHGLDNEYMNFMDWNNLMGDPGTHIITGVPREIEVSHVQAISPGESRVTVFVDDDVDEVPMSDALVCLYMGDDYHEVILTNENGEAEFLIDRELEEGELLVTVTKHNVKPYLGEISVTEKDYFLGAHDPQVEDDDDNDGDLNPGETVELSVSVSNFGSEVPEGQVVMSVSSNSPWIVTQEDDIELDEIPDVNESVSVSFGLEVHPSCPDGEEILIPIDLTNGEAVWSSMISATVESPAISINDIDFSQALNPGSVVNADVSLRNVGSKRLVSSTASIWSENYALRVVTSQAGYPSIPVGSSRSVDGNEFRVSAHPLAIPGMTAWMGIRIETEDGFIDSSRVQVTIGSPEETDPFGPDEYGYVCYDSGDDWELTPEYDWIEINRNVDNYDFRGDALDLSDRGDNGDESVVVDLPFDFQYYGESFNQITVCTNGWAAFGDQGELAAFRNRHIGQALGPNAQLCVWWDNLIMTNDSEILTYYDDDRDVFIIEWSQMRRLVEVGQGESETFQIILRNPETYVTETGDGIIIFQYKDVENQRQAAHNDTPYCTIGIGNLDDSGGLEYTYWNGYPDGAKEIESEMAIMFITSTGYSGGAIQGTVTDAETGEPIPNANILLTRGFGGVADENGYYIVEDVLANDDYFVTTWAQGWNDSTLGEFEVMVDETLSVDFSLLHPEFNTSQEQFSDRVSVDHPESVEFFLTNSGNGILEWAVKPTVEFEMEFEEWEHRAEFLVNQVVDDSHVEGAVFIDDLLYAAGGGNDTNYVYVINRDGEEVNRFMQYDDSRYGMRDLAWDGELIWGSESETLYGFTTDGELVAQFDAPVRTVQSIAWDSDHEVLWVSSQTEGITGVDREGNEIFSLERPPDNRIYGLAYWNDAPDRFKLYFASRQGGSYSVVYKMDIETEEIIRVVALDVDVGGTPRLAGLYISNQYDPFSWVLVTTMAVPIERGGDRVDVWQLGNNSDWMNLEPDSGTILPDEEQEIMLTIDVSGFPMGTELVGNLVFHHNASDGVTELPVSIDVLAGPGVVDDRTLQLMAGWNMVSLNVVPEVVDIPELMMPLVENGLLALMKNGSGQFYSPDDDFNNIQQWEVAEGYKMYLNDATEWMVEGAVVDPADSLNLNAGWNMISYYPRDPVEVTTALSGIENELIIAKDISGHFYLPDFDYSNMNPMSEGYGYQVKVADDVALVYQSGDQAAVATSIADPVHFQTVSRTDDNMSLLLIGDKSLIGQELGVFVAELLVGSGRFDGNGRCGVSVWGSGDLEEKESLSFKLWNGYSEQDATVETVQGAAEWSVDGIFIGSISESLMPVEFGIKEAYPNPFNSSIRIRFGVEQAGNVSLDLYDLTGRRVTSLSNSSRTAGYHTINFEAGSLPSGLYIARMNQNTDNSGTASSSVKLMLLK